MFSVSGTGASRGGATHLLSGLYPDTELRRYVKRLVCSPQPAMRRVDHRADGFACSIYQDYAWVVTAVVATETDARVFWLSDPWLPNQLFEWGNVSTMTVGSEASTAWTERQWDEALAALSFHVTTETSARPHEIGPESSWTSGRVYQRLLENGAAAQVYWYEGRSRWDDLRGSCPVRTDLPAALRCVVLAEAMVLLQRRPHHEGYVYVDVAPAGVATEAASILKRFDVPARTLDLLVR